MITGAVTPFRAAVLRLSVHGPDGRNEELEATVDTGFNGFLTLPPGLVSRLDLPVQAPTRVSLADGSEAHLDVVEVTIEWDGRLRTVPALVADDGMLIGMSLLYGSRLVIEVIDGGPVTIQRLHSA
jgi:clan AA aspartic protease